MKTKALHIFALLLCSVLYSPLTHATSRLTDSLAHVISTLQGSERLDAHLRLCNLYSGSALCSSEVELRAIESYLHEARSQGHLLHEGNARSLQIFAFYNNALFDALFDSLPVHLEFMRNNEQWDLYYATWNVKVERLLHMEKIQTAIHEAELMYTEAKHRAHKQGHAIAAYQLGSCYFSLEQHAEAYDFFNEAERLFEADHTGNLINLYNYYWQVLLALQRYDEQLKLADRWQALLDNYCRRNNLTSADIPLYYLYCNVSRVLALFEMGRLPRPSRSIPAWQLPRPTTISLRALLAETDSLRSHRMYAQLAELGSIYRHDLLMHENEHIRDRNFILIVVCITLFLLLVLLVGAYFNVRRMRVKNKLLAQFTEQVHQSEEKKHEEALQHLAEEEPKHQALFRRLEQLFDEELLYRNPELTKEQVANRLNTTEQELGEVMRRVHYRGFRHYLNERRLACSLELLKEHPRMGNDVIASEAGFNSRATFYRLFREKYGMTPNEYRSAILTPPPLP